jgi:putative heme-binding domain-containing protein
VPRRPALLLSAALTFLTPPAPAQESHRASAPTASNSQPALPTTSAARAAGATLYQTHCALCHGARGEGGRGPILALPILTRATDDAALLRIISGGIAGTEMPSSLLPAPQVAQLAAFVKTLGSRPPERVPGDPTRGAALYAGRGACATCHTLRGEGRAFGPDLTSIGRLRSAAHLRHSLTEPAAEVPQSSVPYRSDVSLPENFLFVRATTRDGRTIAGTRLNEDAFSIQLREPSGVIHSFFKADLAALHKDRGFSPMPAYGAVFTSAELDDLVAYLASLRGLK